MLQARGSLQELIDDLNASLDQGYLPAPEVALLKEQGWQVSRFLNGYLRWLRDRKAGQALALHEDSITYADKGDDLEGWLAGLPL